MVLGVGAIPQLMTKINSATKIDKKEPKITMKIDQIPTISPHITTHLLETTALITTPITRAPAPEITPNSNILEQLIRNNEEIIEEF